MIQTMETEFDEINADMSHWQGMWKATDLPASNRFHKIFLSSDPHSSSLAEEGSQSRQPFHAQTASPPWRRSLQVCRSAVSLQIFAGCCLFKNFTGACSAEQLAKCSVLQREGTCSFGSCCWESSNPASQGREQDGCGLLSSGGITDPSAISLSCMNLPCAVCFLVICIALWLAAQTGTSHNCARHLEVFLYPSGPPGS